MQQKNLDDVKEFIFIKFNAQNKHAKRSFS